MIDSSFEQEVGLRLGRAFARTNCGAAGLSAIGGSNYYHVTYLEAAGTRRSAGFVGGNRLPDFSAHDFAGQTEGSIALRFSTPERIDVDLPAKRIGRTLRLLAVAAADINVSGPTPEGLRIVEARADSEPGNSLMEAQGLVATAFGRDPEDVGYFRKGVSSLHEQAVLYVGRLGGSIVSTAFVIRDGEFSSFWNVVTANNQRNRGFGNAIIREALSRERLANPSAGFFFLQTTYEVAQHGQPQAKTVYDSIGFREVSRQDIWEVEVKV